MNISSLKFGGVDRRLVLCSQQSVIALSDWSYSQQFLLDAQREMHVGRGQEVHCQCHWLHQQAVMGLMLMRVFYFSWR